MNSKTLLIESNNSSSKLYTNRQLRKGVVGKDNIRKNNSQWKTDLKFGVEVEPGDEITVSGTQINLRGEPDASMEFSGGLHSEYDEKNALVDNIATIQYGYYFTNTKQYNMNLPLARHVLVDAKRWWHPEFSYWNGEKEAGPDGKTGGDYEPAEAWEAFRKSYPAWALEGCYKSVESFPPEDLKVNNPSPSKTCQTVTRWQIIDAQSIGSGPNSAGPISPFLPPSIGQQACGKNSETALSNGPFSIAHSNEKRLYLLEKMNSFLVENSIDEANWTTDQTALLKTDLCPLTAQEGFQTPTSVAQGLTEQLHQRAGQADNWTNEFVDTSIYLHDAIFALANPSPNLALPGPKQIIVPGGYKWTPDQILTKYPVSQVTDKMLKVIKTSSGSLLEAIFEKKDGWDGFLADIPGNTGWRGKQQPFDWGLDGGLNPSVDQMLVGYWNRKSGTADPDTYPVKDGRKMFYENLLCGDIGRHTAFVAQQEMTCPKSGYRAEKLLFYNFKDKGDPDYLPSANELLSNEFAGTKATEATIPDSQPWVGGAYVTDLVYINQGTQLRYNMTPCDWTMTPPPPGGVTDINVNGACQFGERNIVNADNWGFDYPESAAPLKKGEAIVDISVTRMNAEFNKTRTKTSLSGIEEHSVPAIKKQKNMIFPTNIVATPRAIAQVKKMLWASRKSKNTRDNKEYKFTRRPDVNGQVRDNCKTENMNKVTVAELDYYFLDDGACIGTNSPRGFADPNELTSKFALPCAYSCAQNEGLGAPLTFKDFLMAHNDNYKETLWYKGTTSIDKETRPIPSTPYQYEDPVDSSASNNPLRIQPPIRQGSRTNKMNFKVAWDDEFETQTDWHSGTKTEDPAKGVFLNPSSIFKFEDYDGKPFQYNDWFKPQDPENPLFKGPNGERYDLWEDQSPEQDVGVALVAVYYKEWDDNNPICKEINDNYPETRTDINEYRLEKNFPGIPDFDTYGPVYPGGVDEKRREWYNTPFLAFVMEVSEENKDDSFNNYFMPPMIGENFGISHAFLDGEYAKCINSQRASPKAYNTITQTLKASDTEYDQYTSRHNPLYYNVYDYVPYALIGSSDPNIQFGASSGRFEISDLHTPLFVGNGPWADIALEQNTPSAQASEKIASLNNKIAWTSTISYDNKLTSILITNKASENTTTNGREAGLYYVEGANKVPRQGDMNQEPSEDPYNGNEYQACYSGLPVIPWGELQQDSNEHSVITSQSGVGILNIFVPYANQDIPKYLSGEIKDRELADLHERMSAWYPNTFDDTLFNKMGFEVEQLLPLIANSQSNGFNRSNYNKFIGYNGQNLIDKQANMVYPFTTNGYISGSLNIQGQNRNWVGYDTIYQIVRSQGGQTPPDPPGALDPLGWGAFPDFYGILWDKQDSSSTLRKILPAGDVYEMYSMGGLNYMTGTNVTVESDILVARKQPKKFDYSYLVIYSNIIEQQSNWIGSNKVIPLPAVGYLSRNYSSSDFFYSFASDFRYTADRRHVINNFDVEIRLPNGKLANLEENSSIIFKVIKAIPPQLQLKPPKPPTKQEMTKEEKEEDLYYKSLIS